MVISSIGELQRIDYENHCRKSVLFKNRVQRLDDHKNKKLNEVLNMSELNKNKEQEQEKPKGDTPAFTGDGVAVWINQDKHGKDYLTIQLLGKFGIKVNAFEYQKKEE